MKLVKSVTCLHQALARTILTTGRHKFPKQVLVCEPDQSDFLIDMTVPMPEWPYPAWDLNLNLTESFSLITVVVQLISHRHRLVSHMSPRLGGPYEIMNSFGE